MSSKSSILTYTLTSKGYNKVDSFVRQLESCGVYKGPAFAEYAAEPIEKRIVQQIVNQIATPYLSAVVKRFHDDESPLTELYGDRIGNIYITRDGVIKLSYRYYVQCIFLYIACWALILFYWAKSLFTSQRCISSTLLYGAPAADISYKNSDERFVDYLKNGNIPALKQSSHVITQAVSPVHRTNPAFIQYDRYPVYRLLSCVKAGINQHLSFVISHAWYFLYFFFLIVRYPILGLLWRDFAEHACAKHLNNLSSIESIVLTNSNWPEQQLWMTSLRGKSFVLHMALYSLNNSEFVYKSDPVESAHPIFRHLMTDNVYIWFDEYKDVLKTEGINILTTTTGPITWYMPGSDQAQTVKRQICVFDITPFSDEFAEGTGFLSNYGDSDNVTRFMTDIISIAREIYQKTGSKISLVLKQKRKPHPVLHDQKYLKMLEQWVDDGWLHIVEPDTNLYDLFDESMMVVVYPWSSPAYVAASRGKPAVFYDITQDIIDNSVQHEYVEFINEFSAFKHKIHSVFGIEIDDRV